MVRRRLKELAVMISLLVWLQGLLADPDARAAFVGDPDGFTDAAGFDHLTAADFHDALVLVSDTEPISYDDRFRDQFGSLFHHVPVEAGELADQSPGDYLRDYLAAGRPAEADPGHPFADSSDNDPLAHLTHDSWAATGSGADHAISAAFGSDAGDPGFGAGFTAGSGGHSGHDPGFASGDPADAHHPSGVTAASQLGPDAWPAHDLTRDLTHDGAGHGSIFGEDLRAGADHADPTDHDDHHDHSEHEADHPPL